MWLFDFNCFRPVMDRRTAVVDPVVVGLVVVWTLPLSLSLIFSGSKALPPIASSRYVWYG